ncbi:MAG: Fic family protein [Verrucomicrobia bacterium]|nr:Fic family protein [Verrucomicrobiota bacterium]
MSSLSPLPILDLSLLDSREVWMAIAEAERHLAELKGLCETLPNQAILISTLSIQEAKDSSEIENIITTHDEIFADREEESANGSVKEVRYYVEALQGGFEEVRKSGLIRLKTLLDVQTRIEPKKAGLRKLPGTVLKNPASGRIVYEPPQSAAEVESLMNNLIDFLHAEDDLNPILRMAIAHHQFESIHPFYDGNGRTGRILNLLILQKEGLLDLPVLYLSRYITTTKGEYYRLLQETREKGLWKDWCLYMIRGVSMTARSEIALVKSLRALMQETKVKIRSRLEKIYSQDLLNNLFRHPYTKIEFVEKELGISRVTASKYLELLVTEGLLRKEKRGKTNFFINEPLFQLLSNVSLR